MVRVVKFVVTSFCAGRRVSVFQSQWIFAVKVFSVQGPAARKPYNPILGEFFECSFRADTSRLTVEQPVEGGPQAKPGDQSVLDVTFVSEQVSHHPPSELTCCHLHRLRLLFLGHSFIFLCFTSVPAWKSMLERGKNVKQKEPALTLVSVSRLENLPTLVKKFHFFSNPSLDCLLEWTLYVWLVVAYRMTRDIW